MSRPIVPGWHLTAGAERLDDGRRRSEALGPVAPDHTGALCQTSVRLVDGALVVMSSHDPYRAYSVPLEVVEALRAEPWSGT